MLESWADTLLLCMGDELEICFGRFRNGPRGCKLRHLSESDCLWLRDEHDRLRRILDQLLQLGGSAYLLASFPMRDRADRSWFQAPQITDDDGWRLAPVSSNGNTTVLPSINGSSWHSI